LDPEGYPERLPLQQNENLETLLSSGTIIKHEVKVETIFKDGSSLSAVLHDQAVYEFQYVSPDKVFSCRLKYCHCGK
ncbi:MAG: hypothetical protein ACXVC3_20100, partial [Bdellovibrio sp.]